MSTRTCAKTAFDTKTAGQDAHAPDFVRRIARWLRERAERCDEYTRTKRNYHFATIIHGPPQVGSHYAKSRQGQQIYEP